MATLKQSFVRSSITLHSGELTQVTVCPAPEEEGRYFIRTDLENSPKIPANLSSLGETTLSTELQREGAKVRTVEHLLASLIGSGITSARIEIKGPEVPLLDGSAQDWLTGITTCGITENVIKTTPILTELIHIQEGDKWVTAIPSTETRFTYGIDFDYTAIGNQWYSWKWDKENFRTEIAPARTFGFADQIDKLRQMGLIKGGSLDNALVCDRQGWLNPPLRFENEPVRHKLLDLLGDLSLLGTIPQAHYIAYKASHHLHVQLAQKIQDSLEKSIS